MKEIFALIFFISLNTSTQSQNKTKEPEFVTVAGSSEISTQDKWIANFSIKKDVFNVYCGYQQPSSLLQQEANDTLEVYKISYLDGKISKLEITKFATRNGKISVEGFYKIEKDTLTVVTDYYDYMGAFRITDLYVTDQYGFKKLSDKMEAIHTDSLSDRYIKPSEMLVPPAAKE